MESSVNINFDKICRTCLLESSQMVPLLTKMDGGKKTLFDVLLFVLNSQLTVNSKLPKLICGECELLLCKLDEFKRQCHDSEKVLLDILTSNTTQPYQPIKLESSTKSNDQQEIDQIFEVNTVNMIEPATENTSIQKIHDTKGDTKFDVKETIKEELSDDFSDSLENILVDDRQSVLENRTCHCGMVFTETDQYQTHLDSKTCFKSDKNVSLPVKCELCNAVFKNTKSFKIHMRTHNFNKESKQPKLQCVLCSKSFRKKSNLITHMEKKCSIKTVKRVVKKEVTNQPSPWLLPIKCEKCDTIFNCMKLFKNHSHQHNNEAEEYFQCSLCMRKFKKKSSLVTHLKNHEHKDNIKYTCHICKRQFKYQAHLDNHNIAEHNAKKDMQSTLPPLAENNSTDKRHRCGTCSKSFTMLSTLTDHMRTHTGEKPFLCSVCGRGFTQKTNLAQHMRRHLGLKPFKCGECERRFVSKGELDAHARKHTGAHPFVCASCGHGFTTSSSLRKHERIHTGERPYACDLCPMKFAASGTLKSHRRTHTGEKPYQCSYCEKAFVQRQDLVSHIRCHTGERPFVCAHCGQAFRKPSALKAHAKTHKQPPIMGMPMHNLQTG